MKQTAIILVIVLSLFVLSNCSRQINGASLLGAPDTNTEPVIPSVTASTKIAPTPSPRQSTRSSVENTVESMSQTQEYRIKTAYPATLEARGVSCRDGFIVELPYEIFMDSNEQWTVFTCSPIAENMQEAWTPGVVDYGKRYTLVTSTDHSQSWTIQHHDFDYSEIDRPDAMMSTYHWSIDGKYVYLHPLYYPGPSGFTDSAFLRTHVISLYRLHLETGDFELVLADGQFGAFAISPNDQYLIYSEEAQPYVIHIKDLENNQDSQIGIDETVMATGAFIWNTDSTKVVFFSGYKNGDEYRVDDLSSVSIFVLDLESMNIKEVVSKDARILSPDQCSEEDDYWIDQNTLCLYSIGVSQNTIAQIYSLDIRYGTVTYLRPFP
jgi:hypothetical protein